MKQENIFGILGIRINNLDKNQLLQKIDSFLNVPKYHWIATINAEILVHTHNNPEYACIINKSDINLIDGSGPQYIGKLKNPNNKIYRHPGVELIEHVLQLAYNKKLKILFFGGQEFKNNQSTAEKTAEIFQKKYPGIDISTQQGGRVEIKNNKIIFEDNILEKLQSINPDVILVALSNPIQEKFVYLLQNYLPHIRLAIGIGGSFNMISGYLKRAPKIFRVIGLEWLWRLMMEPKRFKRIFRAVIVFPYLVVFRKIFPKYRPNVSICIINQNKKVLLCERKNDSGHWQFPQGGIEKNHTAKQTVFKELKEEVGIEKNKIAKLYQCKQTHKYLWSKNYLKTNFINGYKGQKQSVWIVKFSGNDDEITVDNREFKNYQWANIDEAKKIIHPYRLAVWEIAKKNLENI